LNELWPFVGRFHPLLVHFPIGLLVLAGALRALAWRARRRAARTAAPDIAPTAPWFEAAIPPLLSLGALSAIAAAGAGYLLGTSGGYGGDTYLRHQLAGFVVAATASLAALTAYVRGSSGRGFWARFHATALVAALAALLVAGHLGATLTHGEAWLTEHAPGPVRWVLARVGLSAPAPPAAPSLDRALVYASLVEPVLQARCVSCHGAARAEGGLRLDSPEALTKGGENGPVVAPGRADRSEIVRRVYLPPSHADAMPPSGQRPLAPAEAALVRWWIDRGARVDAKVVDAEMSPDVLPAIEAVFGPLARGGPTLPRVTLPPPDSAALAKLTAAGVSVVPVAAGTPFLHVHTTNARVTFDDAALKLAEPIAAHVLWLDVSRTRITDAGLASVAKLTNLTRLDLNHTAITDAGLAQLASLTRLETLNLYGTTISDAGLDRLKPLTNLRTVHLWQTRVTPEAVARLKTALPSADITIDAAAPPVAAPLPAIPSSVR
jgi:uncharacterized membrane protein